MKTQEQLKRETIDTMADIKDKVDDPDITGRPATAQQANSVGEAYRRGAKYIEKITGRKTPLPSWAKGESNFPPAKEVVTE